MEAFHNLRNDIKSKFRSISCKPDGNEEQFIEFINLALQRYNKYDLRPLEVILDLTLILVDEKQNFTNQNVIQNRLQQLNDDEYIAPGHHDADDEGSDERFIFPCQLSCENCHPDQLLNYHHDHLKTYYYTSTNAQIIKHAKLVEFVIEYMLQNLRSMCGNRNFDMKHDNLSNLNGQANMNNNENDIDHYIMSVVKTFSKLEKVCMIEKTNCRILSKTNVLDLLLDTLTLLAQKFPNRQDIYLDPLLKFAFLLANFKILGSQMRKIFAIARENSIQLDIFLKNLNKILIHQDDILRNIQPITSISFPSPSTTASEIYNNSSVSNSWHWRMRRKVLEFKKKLIRNIEPQVQKGSSSKFQLIDDKSTVAYDQNMTPSWLECSIITPLSSITPLIQNNHIKFSVSLWLNLCGDLFVTLDPNSIKKDGLVSRHWRHTRGQWLRLISNRRLARRRVKDRRRFSRSKISATRTTRDIITPNRDSEEDIDMRCANNRMQSQTSQLAHFNQIRSIVDKSNDKLDKSRKNVKSGRNRLAPSLSLPPTKRVPQEFMLHLVSFAIDNLTIEFWLNVKSMLITAKLCRVGTEGQTSLLDSVEFKSYLESTCQWSHLVISIYEEPSSENFVNIQSVTRNTLNIQLTVNAVHKINVKLSYNAGHTTASNFACLIGCERSTFGYVWKLSQINLYKNLPPEDMILFLYGKGPDFSTISNLRQSKGSSLPLPDLTKRSIKTLMNPLILELYTQLNEERCLNWLTQNIVSMYVAHKADHFLDYSQNKKNQSFGGGLSSNDFNSSNRFIQVQILNFTRTLRLNFNQGFGSALIEAGGIESMLVLFADVIRRCPDQPKVISLALSNLLRMSETNYHHLNKFLDELDGLKLIEGLLAHPACIITRCMFDMFFEYCVFRANRKMCLIKSSKLIYNLLDCWRAWHKDIRIAKRLYSKLYKLLLHNGPTRSDTTTNAANLDIRTSFIDHNIKMVNDAGGLDILMNILRQSLVPMEDFVPKINHEIIELIVSLMSLLVNHPPTLDIIYDIMDFLMFLHPDHKAYVDCDKVSFLHTLRTYAKLDGDQRSYHLNNIDTLEDWNYTQNRYQIDEFDTDLNYNRGSSTTSLNCDFMNDQTNSTIDTTNNNLRRSTSSEIFSTNQDQSLDGRHHMIGEPRSTYPIMPGYELRPKVFKLETLPEFEERIVPDYEGSNKLHHKEDDQEPTKVAIDGGQHQLPLCNNRSYAVGCVADMLASIVKLTPDSGHILTEVFTKPIIDPRKLIVLANNNSSFVREKVLRLFLYSMKACYSLDLHTVLIKFEQQDESSKGSKFKTCIPIELMGRQLLCYPTTMKMIQLCYSIIVGVDDLEAVESFCFAFGVDTIDNNLKLNVFILMLHLMTRLEDAREIESAVKFSYTSAKQILQFDDNQLTLIVIKDNLFDSLMKLYFSFIGNNFHKTPICPSDNINSLSLELDRCLILIVKYYIENMSTSNTMKAFHDMMAHFDLMNSHLDPKDQSILRDRQVKALSACLRYCKLYETSAREAKLIPGRVGYYITSLFSSKVQKFPNSLTEYDLELAAGLIQSKLNFDHLTTEQTNQSTLENGIIVPNNHNGDDNFECNSSSLNSDRSFSSHHRDSSEWLRTKSVQSARDVPILTKISYISETELIERFKGIITLVVNFILTREQGVIASPYERQFIEDCIEFMSFLLDGDSDCDIDPNCHWIRILCKLRPFIQANLSKLILYLLSPCESMNPDERKYYAQKLLNLFDIHHLLSLLNDGTTVNYRILLLFLEDLIRPESPIDSDAEDDDEIFSDMDEDLEFGYDTEQVLRNLIAELRNELDSNDQEDSSNGRSIANIFGGVQSTLNGFSSNPYNRQQKPDIKLRDIWLNDLIQLKDEARDRCQSLKNVESNYVQMSTTGSDPTVENSGDSWTICILEGGRKITHDVVIDKHEQRKAYLEVLKQEKVFNYHVRQQWLSLIIGQTHERSIWFMESHYPRSWELNPVEGPSRIRRRLRPTKLNLSPRFMRKHINHRGPRDNYKLTFEQQNNSLVDDWYYLYSPHPLCSLVINPERSVMNATELRARMFTTDKIHINCDCSIIRPSEVFVGEISIASWCMHFIGERKPMTTGNPTTMSDDQADSTAIDAQQQPQQHNTNNNLLNLVVTIVEDLWFDEIVEVMDRRYQLRDVGLEIFLTNNMTYLLSFNNNKEREEFKRCLFKEQQKMINLQRHNHSTNLNRLTQLWREGCLTNFDFLTCLNKLAGRSFNDLMQYPVFPFVLSNYTTQTLDLTNEKNFRNLKRPMAIQNPEKEATFINTYNNSVSSNINVGMASITQQAYHYGNHYSNTASVLHFLVRLPPFTQMMIQYQDNNFDQPDRTFHSLANTWQLITQTSNTDFKELIPEFFFLPEMFVNFEQFELGRKQNDELVDDVKLPQWCPKGDPRLFTLIHRQALESDYVTTNLNHWIDLIFGYKQTGKAAIEALNVFHPATYYGMIDLERQNQNSSQHSSSNNSSQLLVDWQTTISPLSNKDDSKTLQTNKSTLTDAVANTDAGSQQTIVDGGFCSNTEDNHQDLSGALSREISSTTMATTRRTIPRRRQADSVIDIERLAMETMIKTYGQMPKQLYNQPMKPRYQIGGGGASSLNGSHFKIYKTNLLKSYQSSNKINNLEQEEEQHDKRIEPLAQVFGLKWGSFVGSPDEGEIVAIKHKQIIGSSLCAPTSAQSNEAMIASRMRFGNNRKLPKYKLHLLPNGDIAIMGDSSSLLLSYRADRKSGSGYQLSIPSSTRYSRRSGLSTLARMNLFSSMIISRQQFAYLVPANNAISSTSTATSGRGNGSTNASSSRGGGSGNKASASSLFTTLGTTKNKFSLDSLSRISWSHLDGTLRIRHPAPDTNKPNVPLVQADSTIDSMSSCCSVPELNLLIVGYNSGAACAHIITTSFETVSNNSTLTTQSFDEYNNNSMTTSNYMTSTSRSSSYSDLSALTSSIRLSGFSQESKAYEEQQQQSSTTAKTLSNLLMPSKLAMQTVRCINKATRWLYSHTKRINCIKIDIGFGIVVTGSDDGTSVIWDLNSLAYVRTIKYLANNGTGNKKNVRQDGRTTKQLIDDQQQEWMSDFLCDCGGLSGNKASNLEQFNNNNRTFISQSTKAKRLCQCCRSGVCLIALSSTLGDIASVKKFQTRSRLTTSFRSSSSTNNNNNNRSFDANNLSYNSAYNVFDHRDRSPNLQSDNINGGDYDSESYDAITSVIYVHTINGSLVGLVNSHTEVTALTYSSAPEGVSVNVIGVGLADGVIRLYSSWDLTKVKEFHITGLNLSITSLLYSRDNQLLYCIFEDGELVVLTTKRHKNLTNQPKEIIL